MIWTHQIGDQVDPFPEYAEESPAKVAKLFDISEDVPAGHGSEDKVANYDQVVSPFGEPREFCWLDRPAGNRSSLGWKFDHQSVFCI